MRASSRLCAVPLRHVVEIMRPLPIRGFAGSPEFVAGIAVIRGAAMAVLDLEALLGKRGPTPPGRFVVIRTGAAHLALAVEGVLGVRDVPESELHDLPPLLRETDARLVEKIGALDSELLIVLQASRILPENAWQVLAKEGLPCP